MTQKIGALVFFLGISCTLFAQTETVKKVSRRPDIPGTFALEFGFNFDSGAPEQFSLGFLGITHLQPLLSIRIKDPQVKF